MNRSSGMSRSGSLSRSSMSKTDTFGASKPMEKQSKAGSTRRTGDNSESKIMDAMNCHGLSFKGTRNSGATSMDGDMNGHGYLVECKYKTNASHTVRSNEWKATVDKAKRHNLTPALITENQEGELMAHISLDVFLNLINESEHGSNKKPNS